MDRQAVFNWTAQQYGTEPEYLWAQYPSYAVLRGSGGKWYAAVMDVPRSKLGLQGEEKVDILNVKCDPVLVGALRLQPGFLPAYHMNKNSWISILLDGTVSDEEIKTLIDISYALTMPKRGRRPKD